MQDQQKERNSSSLARQRPLGSDESTKTTTYTASTSTRQNSGSGSGTKPYIGSSVSTNSSSDSGSYSYSYSYTGSQSSTGTDKISSVSRDNKEKSGAAPQLLSMLQQQKIQQQQQQLPPRTPHPPVGNVPSEVVYLSPPKKSNEAVSQSVSESSGSYGDSGSYSYSYSYTEEDEATEEEEEYTGSNSSYSYSYSYSDESTDTTKDTALPNKVDKSKREEVTSMTTSSYSEQDSATSGKNKSEGSTTESYSITTGDRSSSGTYTGSSSVRDGSDSYSYSYSYSTDGRTVSGTGSTPTSRTGGSEYTTESSSTRGKRNADTITRSTDEDSYSYSYYSYSYSSKDTTGSGPHRYSSTLPTESEDSEMSLTASDTRTRSGSSSSKSHSLHKDLPPLYPDLKASKALPTSTSTSRVTTTPSSTTTSLIRDDKSSWRSYGDETSRGDSTTGRTRSTESSSRTSTAIGATELVQVREVVTLCAPVEETPRIRALPHSCLIPCGSVNDTVSHIVDRLSDVQQDVLRKEAEEKAAAAAIAAAEEEEKKKNKTKSKKKKDSVKVKSSSDKEGNQQGEEKPKTTIISTDVPTGYFIKKSVKFALKTVGVETIEERALILKGLTLPLPRDALLTLLNHQSQQCLIRRVRSMFCAHDKFQSGEVSLSLTLDILRRCGIAHRDVGDFTISLHILSPKARFPLVCVTQRSLLNTTTTTTTTTTTGQNAPPLESQINEIVVDVCSSVMSVGSVDVCWDEERGDLYVGNRPVAKMMGISRNIARNMLQQLEAMIHVCLSVEACTVHDPTSLCSVLYTPLLTALLSPPPVALPNTKSVILENALAVVMKPMEQLERLAAHHRIQERYLGAGEDTLLRDTLPNREEDMTSLVMQKQQYQQKQQECGQHNIIDWVPKIAAGGDKFETTTPLTVNDVHYDVGLTKLRIAEAVPADARCYCLVSARKSSGGEWMRAVMVPVVSVKPSKKGGFKWTFGKSETDRIFFAGSKTDTLYIEACYDVSDGVTTEGGISGGEMITWCAGHAVIMCSNAKSGTFSVMHGSLIPDNNNDNNNNNNNNSTPNESKLVEPSKGLFCCFRRKQNTTAAKSLTIAIRSLRANSLSPSRSLPSRCLALRRHVPLMARMRDAIVGANFCNNNSNSNSKNKNKGNINSSSTVQPPPLHVLRQQQVQCCLTVAAHTGLMDVMAILWERTLRGKIGSKPKTTEQQHKALLKLASKVVAVHNSIGEEQDAIMNIVARGAVIPGPLNPQAPQRPIYV